MFTLYPIFMMLFVYVIQIAGSRWTVRYTIIPRCGHTVCDNCLHHHVIRDVNSNKHTVISCPVSILKTNNTAVH